MSAELDKQMKKFAAMVVTVNVTPAAGNREGFEDRPVGLIADAAKRAGIYYENEEKN